MFGWLSRLRAGKPSADNVASIHSVTPGAITGSRAGVLMPDGTVVTLPGEPPPAVGKAWFPFH